MENLFPVEFVRRIKDQVYIDPVSLLHALSSPSPVSVRVNPAKWKTNLPESLERVPWCETGYYIGKRPVFTLDPLLHAGCYYVQEASSMFLEVVLRCIGADRSGLRILDMSASPGGKTTHLSSLSGPDSIVIANEPVRSRIGALVENTIRWGVPKTIISNNDPDDFSRLPSYFDIVLVDAPCSGEGMFRKSDVRKLWSTSGCDMCSDRQKRILKAAWQCLKPGGYLIYSTCTFNPDENESNVKWLIDNHDAGIVRIDTSRYEGVTEIGNNDFMGCGLHPGRIRGEGFFIAAVQKFEGNGAPDTVKRSVKPAKPVKGVPDRVTEMIGQAVGSVHLSGDYCYYLPGPYDEIALLREKLNLVKIGTEICHIKRESIIPSHDFSMSSVMKEGVFPAVEISWSDAIRYLRKDTIPVRDEMPKGWFLVTFSGVRLGFMNNIGSRLNNYFPASSRIRMDAAGTEVRVLI
jgi:16S rRNA C967 or C1407 C5-methylase (RsmB/RsmF family)/NOL1/NOP2/fmu family ribosome biogenesis protein